MHELSLMQSIIEIVEREIETHGITRVERITVKVGEMMGVEETSMQLAFEVLAEDTPMAGATLELVYIPGEAYCARCDYRYPVKRYRITCPQCGGGGQIIAGKELYVDSLEVDDSEGD